MKEIASKLLQKIKEHSADMVFAESDSWAPSRLSRENFNPIAKGSCSKPVTYIDGGNLEIFRSPSLSLFFNRTYSTTYINNRRRKCERTEFFSLISADSDGSFVAEVLSPKIAIPNLRYSYSDQTLRTGIRRVQISAIGDAVRRLAEIRMAAEAAEHNSIVVLDGNLEGTQEHEKEALTGLFSQAGKKGATICGLAKTNNLLTESGDSLSAALESMAPKGCWYYTRAFEVKGSMFDVFFVRLSARSRYSFRLDVSRQRCEISEVLSELVGNSSDPVFCGYPYGLMEADRFARVSRQERDSLQLRLAAILGKDTSRLEPYINALNSHAILDRLNF